ncbi:MAG: putative CtpA-like serine protease [Alphaproteobacteria bacterium MarineAlpha5_Bin11]|nr:peptidase S41 [Pelagibacteraceae bacterium]PPR45009.1 MAG: putative CtpA-like serine protease [Alphaproteobacteria bacterium MarineAlpha5_Bin11]PPR51415.1 MAG: putative CtpA-like serine protease [Alphaproteobacteria bacterium MarineAlpha5_Bin10]
MKNTNKKIKKVFNCLLLVVFIIFPTNINADSPDTSRLLDLFGSVFKKVHSNYVEEITEQELIEKAINGMLFGLDPHSRYMNEETYREMQIDTSGKFGGLGIQITMQDGMVKIISPIDDTPAFFAGLEAGDLITQINSLSVVGMTLNEAVDLMRGEPGSKITLTIAREGKELFDVELIRDIIKIQSVKYEILDDVGYIRITSFTEQTSDGLKKAIREIKNGLDNQNSGYILDLRSNPGGLLGQAVKVSSIFLERGDIVSTRGRGEKQIKVYRARPGDITNGKPLVIIINGGSASASEIVAGALQDHKRAIIIGTNSFGKGSVQSIIPIMDYKRKNQGAMSLTTAKYYTPKGRSIQAKGIEPDIYVEQGKFEADKFKYYSESNLKGSLDNDGESSTLENGGFDKEKLPGEDYQLARALDIIKALLILEK